MPKYLSFWHFGEIVFTLGGALVLRAEQVNHSLIHFDTGEDSAAFEDLGEWGTISGFLVQGLVEEDHSRDVFSNGCVWKEQQLREGKNPSENANSKENKYSKEIADDHVLTSL